MRLPNINKKDFGKVSQVDVQRSAFNRSRGWKTMFDSGKLIPFGIVDEVIPGDTYKVDGTIYVRMSSALARPYMDNLELKTYYFYIPMRLVWDNYNKFFGAQDNPADSVSYTIPTATAPTAGYSVETNQDYMGIPTGVKDLPHNNLPLRALNLCWNEWFRDQNIDNSVTVDTDDGPDTYTDYSTLLVKRKKKDYFTTCLPWAQKGTAISVSLSGSAPVEGMGKISQTFDLTNQAVYETDGSGTETYANFRYIYGAGSNQDNAIEEDPSNTGYWNVRANLSASSGFTINSLRESFQLQRMLERDARSGTRYVELVKAHYGVTVPDLRLGRPEFLGGSTTPILVNQVQQTSESGTTDQGYMTGWAHGTSTREGFTKSFTEHGYILGVCCVEADLTYQQGLDKMWSRSTRADHYFPALAHLGEQAVTSIELYAQDPATDTGATGTPDNERVFGYQERWAEYRYAPSHITGKLRSTYATPLDMWHLSEEFSSLPTLSSSFLDATPPVSRVVTVTSEPEFVLDSYFNVTTVRPMPKYGTPGYIDHF